MYILESIIVRFEKIASGMPIVVVVRLQRISFKMGHMLMCRTKQVLVLHCIELHLGKLTCTCTCGSILIILFNISNQFTCSMTKRAEKANT